MNSSRFLSFLALPLSPMILNLFKDNLDFLNLSLGCSFGRDSLPVASHSLIFPHEFPLKLLQFHIHNNCFTTLHICKTSITTQQHCNHVGCHTSNRHVTRSHKIESNKIRPHLLKTHTQYSHDPYNNTASPIKSSVWLCMFSNLNRELLRSGSCSDQGAAVHAPCKKLLITAATPSNISVLNLPTGINYRELYASCQHAQLSMSPSHVICVYIYIYIYIIIL